MAAIRVKAYLGGRGVEGSISRGFTMLGWAAALGSEHACGILARANAEGRNGLDKNPQEATRLYREMKKVRKPRLHRDVSREGGRMAARAPIEMSIRPLPHFAPFAHTRFVARLVICRGGVVAAGADAYSIQYRGTLYPTPYHPGALSLSNRRPPAPPSREVMRLPHTLVSVPRRAQRRKYEVGAAEPRGTATD